MWRGVRAGRTARPGVVMFFAFAIFGMVPVGAVALVPLANPKINPHDLFVAACVVTAIALFFLGAYKANFNDKRCIRYSIQIAERDRCPPPRAPCREDGRVKSRGTRGHVGTRDHSSTCHSRCTGTFAPVSRHRSSAERARPSPTSSGAPSTASPPTRSTQKRDTPRGRVVG